MKKSEDIKELAKALSDMQSEMESAIKDTKAFKYKYADLAAVWGVLRKPLTKNGLSVSQDTFNLPEGPSVTTLVMHTSGQWLEAGPLTIPMGKKDAHSAGSSITYCRRYQLCAILGVTTETEDDDGQAAQKAAPVNVPVKEKCTEEEYKGFIDRWAKIYDRNLLNLYIEKRSEHFGVDSRQTVFLLIKDQNMFEKNFNIWKEQKSKLPDKPS